MNRSISFLVAAALFGAAGIFSLFADNNDNQVAKDVYVDEWSDVHPQPVDGQFDAGRRRPQLKNAPANAPPNRRYEDPATVRQPVVSEKQKRKYQIQVTCDRSQRATSVVQEPSDFAQSDGESYFGEPETLRDTAPREFLADELNVPVWLYCDEIEMKTAKANEAGKPNGYDLKIAGPFIIESPGLLIRGMGLEVQNGEMAFTNGTITSGGFPIAVEKCKLPFVIKSLQIDSVGQEPAQEPNRLQVQAY